MKHNNIEQIEACQKNYIEFLRNLEDENVQFALELYDLANERKLPIFFHFLDKSEFPMTICNSGEINPFDDQKIIKTISKFDHHQIYLFWRKYHEIIQEIHEKTGEDSNTLWLNLINGLVSNSECYKKINQTG